MRNQTILIAATLFLVACEGQVSIQLSGTPPERVDGAILQIESLTLLSDSQNDVELQLDIDSDVSFLTLGRGRSTTLLSRDDVPTGNYSGIQLNLNAQTAALDSYITQDAQDISLSLNGNKADTSTSFRIQEDEDLQLSLYFDLRSALAISQDQDGNLALTPRLQLANAASTGQISGDISTALLTDSGCDNDDSPEQGEVIYAYRGAEVVADELDQADAEPAATALISRDAIGSDYVIGPLAEGPYTLALTCEANLDAPLTDDGIRFLQTRLAEIEAGKTTSLSFE